MADTLLHLPPAQIAWLDPDHRDRTTKEHQDFLHNKLIPGISKSGIRNPLTVTKAKAGEKPWKLLAGGTRLQAALLLNLATVPAREVEALSPGDALLEQLQENEHRRNFTALEKTSLWAAILKAKPEWSQADLARATGENPASINRALTVKDTLTEDELNLVLEGKIPFRSAYIVASAFPSEAARKPWMERAKEMTADKLEHEIKKQQGKPRGKKPKDVVLVIDGITFKLPGDSTWDTINATKAKFIDLLGRAQRNGLPPSSLPGLK